jgi:hypothetical protein
MSYLYVKKTWQCHELNTIPQSTYLHNQCCFLLHHATVQKREKTRYYNGQSMALTVWKISKFGYPGLSQDNLEVIVNCAIESVSSAGAMLLLSLRIILDMLRIIMRLPGINEGLKYTNFAKSKTLSRDSAIKLRVGPNVYIGSVVQWLSSQKL